jgi:hypothetical protein
MSTDTTPSGKEEVVPETPNPTLPRKKFSRRKVIAFAGTGTLVLVAGGGVWRAADQGSVQYRAGTRVPALGRLAHSDQGTSEPCACCHPGRQSA